MQVYKKYELTGDPKSKSPTPTRVKRAETPVEKSPEKSSQEVVRVDETQTISLIERLDPESKRTLNALVQSVLMTQQDNDKQKLSLITEKRKLVAEQKKLQE